MAWPTQPGFGRSHVDEGTDSPAQARADLNLAMVDLESVIVSYATPLGVATLDADGLLPLAQLRTNEEGAPPRLMVFSGDLSVPPALLPRGKQGGVAGLDGAGHVPESQLPPSVLGPSRFVSFRGAGPASWEVPDGVHRIKAIVTGAGGGGGSGNAVSSSFAGGGGGGGTLIAVLDAVPGQSIVMTIGAGGLGASAADSAGGAGGDSVLTHDVPGVGLVTLIGGGGGGGGPAGAVFNAGNPGVPQITTTAVTSVLELRGGLGEGNSPNRGGSGGGTIWQDGVNTPNATYGGGGGVGGGSRGDSGSGGLIVIEY